MKKIINKIVGIFKKKPAPQPQAKASVEVREVANKGPLYDFRTRK